MESIMKKKLFLLSLLLVASASTHCYWGYRGYGWGPGYGFGLGWGAGIYSPYYAPYYYHPYPYYAPPARSVSPAELENAKQQGQLDALKSENDRKEKELEKKRNDKLNRERKQLEADQREQLRIKRQKELDEYDEGSTDSELYDE